MSSRTSTQPASSTDQAPKTADSIVISLVGSGGDGVVLFGDLLLRMAARQGLYGMLVHSYGPQIKGGESAVTLRLAREEVCYEGDASDVLLCFRTRDLKRFSSAIHLHPGSQIILDAADQGDLPEAIGHAEKPTYRYPFATFMQGIEVEGEPKNMLGLGLLGRALGWPLELARQALEERFAHRPKNVARNLPAVEKGYRSEGVPALPRLQGHGRPLVIESGNQAVARGAIAAGMRFFAGYPITPSCEILEAVIEELPRVGGLVVQAEDEIASYGMVIGASYGGTPSMSATSGPGLSLMTEMMGLSSMAEVPSVIVDCQRAGPATGIPSRTEQSDLFHAVYGGHGDLVRVVLGVYDVVHAREAMFKAFHLSEKYQVPVIVLSEAYIAQRRQVRDPVVEPTETPRRRIWQPGESPVRFNPNAEGGVDPFRIPGTPGGQYVTAGIEHTPEGFPSADTANHQLMNAKRFRKYGPIAEETRSWYRTLGQPGARRGIIAWGSLYGVLGEWVKCHPDDRAFLPEIIHPFPLEGFEQWRKGLESLAVVELSYRGQLHQYMAGLTDMKGVRSLGRSGGVPLSTRELEQMLAEASR
jgi:2-oxoglutarate ferredoxin oxidoreductase subunit alpha